MLALPAMLLIAASKDHSDPVEDDDAADDWSPLSVGSDRYAGRGAASDHGAADGAAGIAGAGEVHGEGGD